MWKMTFTPRARKDLLGIDKPVCRQIIKKLDSVLAAPEKSFEKLSGFNYHKLRAGDYRVIAYIDFAAHVVEIRRVGHRKNIYERL